MVVFTMDHKDEAAALEFGPPLPVLDIMPVTTASEAQMQPVTHRNSQSTESSFELAQPEVMQQFSTALLSHPIDSYLPQTMSSFGNIHPDATWVPNNGVSVPATIKRSKSTPNVRAKAMLDAQASLAADKRRNKLGYHRTSVACGNCRRRKIRCLPAEDPHAGKCSNCIRLKKECNYFPVEQSASSERRPRAASKPEFVTGLTSNNSSPSPALSGEGAGEGCEHSQPTTPALDSALERRNRKSSVSSNGRGSRTHSRVASRRPSLARMNTAPYPVKQLDFGAPMEHVNSSGWDHQPYFETPTSAVIPVDTPSLDDNSPVVWGQLAESPMTPAHFGGFMHPSMPDLRSVPSNLDLSNGYREDVGWPLQPLSSNLEQHPLRPKQSVEYFGSHTNSPLIPDAYSMSASATSLVPSETDHYQPHIVDSRNSFNSIYMQPSWNNSFPGQPDQFGKGFEPTGVLYADQPLSQVLEENSMPPPMPARHSSTADDHGLYMAQPARQTA